MCHSLSISGGKGTVIPTFEAREHNGGRFGLITLDSGRDATNAIGPDTLHSLAAALDAADVADVAAVAVTGNRRWFSSGADLGYFTAATQRSEVLDTIRSGHAVFRRLSDSARRPTFAFI